MAADSGLVSVYRYPCVSPGACAVLGRGHSSHVTNVRWCVHHNIGNNGSSNNGSYGNNNGGNSNNTSGHNSAYKLLSVGGNDKCLFVWNVKEN